MTGNPVTDSGYNPFKGTKAMTKNEKANVFNVRNFNAIGNGKDKDTAAIQKAINVCTESGGGVVYCPPGKYLIGTIYLKSNVEFHLEAGATILGSPDRADYDNNEKANDFCKNQLASLYIVHLICARNARNVAITGLGTIDGNGRAFFVPFVPGAPGAPGVGYSWRLAVRDWRPGHLLAFIECQDVLVRDVHIVDSPCFTIWPLGCDRVRIQGVVVLNNRDAPNTDGIDPDCCNDVRISDCYLYCADDCIALKTNTAILGKERACENITVTNCTLITPRCGVRIGCEGDGPIRNCTFSNLVMSNTRTGINMLVPRSAKYRVEHGPTIENVSFSNIVMDTKIAIFLWIGDDASSPGCIRNIHIANVSAAAVRGCYIGGSKTIPIEDLRIANMKLTLRGEMDDLLSEVPYPYGIWDYWPKPQSKIQTHGLPYGFYGRYVKGLSLHNIEVEWKDVTGPWRSALRCENVENVDINGLVTRSEPGLIEGPMVHLTDVRGAFLRGCRAEAETGSFLKLDGALSSGIAVIGNDLSISKKAFDVADDVPSNAFQQTANLLSLGGQK